MDNYEPERGNPRAGEQGCSGKLAVSRGTVLGVATLCFRCAEMDLGAAQVSPRQLRNSASMPLMDTVFQNYPVRSPKVYRVRSFTRTHRTLSFLRLWLVAQYARVLAMLGNLVVVVGSCRAGKTVLIGCATDKIINGCNWPGRSWDDKVALTTADVADGIFAIDELHALDDAALLAVVGTLAKQRRGFLLTAQSIRDPQLMAVCLQWASQCAGKRIQVISLE